MVAKKFNDVFSKVSLSGEVIEAFKNVNVYDLKLNRKEKSMLLKLKSENILNEKNVFDLKRELINKVPGVANVNTIINYEVSDEEDILHKINLCWDNILYFISEKSQICRTMMNNCTYEIVDNLLYVHVKNNAALYLIRQKIDKEISQKLLDEVNVNIKVVFKNVRLSEVEIKQYELNQQKKENKIFENIIVQKAQVENQKNEEKLSIASDNISKGIIIGKEISGNISKIIDTKIEGEKVIIEGEIFNLDAREIKGEKYVVSFDITDYSDSTTVKFFVDKKIYDKEINDVLKSGVKKGTYFKVKGEVQFDKYAKELNIMSRDISLGERPIEKMDNAEEKRVELHLHTQMSSMDGMTNVKKLIERAAKWGHKAIAVTDHGVVQAFPDAMDEAKKQGIKVIYGVEGYIVDDLGTAVIKPRGQGFDETFIVFDIETTGLSNESDRITEIGAVKIRNNQIIDRFSTFVNPERPIPPKIVELTGITDEMVKDAPTIDKVLLDFKEFISDGVLVAHNASFDVGFIKKNAERNNILISNTYIDTLEISRSLLPELKKHKLNIIAEHLGVSLEGHHRAVNDAEATAEIFIKFMHMLKEKEVHNVDDINIFVSRTVNYKKLDSYHAIILVKNYQGLRNLYDLVSLSHIDYFFKRPRIPKSQFMKHREGLILGSACEAGELYRAITNHKPKEYIESIVNFYDYLEIQPLGNNKFMIESERYPDIKSYDDIIKINKYIIELGQRYNKRVVATGDVHFMDPQDASFRKIIMAAEGFKDADNQAPLYFRTTEEMLKEFNYLEPEKAKEIVITNPNLIADEIEFIKPIPDETFPPKIEGAEEELRKITMDKAHELYGNPLPPVVESRLDRELGSIIKNGFSVLYIIAQKLVWKSVEDGYLVGSRGSVGSSFVANMAGITEVNSLPAHYRCKKCKYSDFDSEIVMQTVKEGGSGCDMPDKKCPVCGEWLVKDGQDIPFETFLGFDGDKEPDIDLNFSGEYQQTAHAYCEELFGKGKVFKAGTIGTLADKTAFGFVKKYLDERGIVAHNAEVNRLINGCTGVKRTTGQHPGGLMVVPSDHDITEFCPIQRPANDVNSTVTTTHFDYHSISGRLLKLDLLGHDDPTVIRMLYDITGINPQTVELGDKDTMSLFESPKVLGVTPEQIHSETGTLGIPEFGTKFVRQMLVKTKPKTFADLLRISGLSHGTDVWNNNAETLIDEGIISLKDTISTRDSIMIYLINKGVDKKLSFKIMEKVRKGKGLTDEDIKAMKAANVPQWYIDSCLKIKYMFPKAHAAAYVMMAFRIAYFKVNYPKAYYAAYFTVRACDDFDYSTMCRGEEIARQAAREIEAKGNTATTKEKNKLTVLELVIEFYSRGFTFDNIDLYKSDSSKFIVTENGLLPPFSSLQGLGVNAAHGIVEGRKGVEEFKTIEEFKEKTSIGKSLVELLKENHVLDGIPETNQLTLF